MNLADVQATLEQELSVRQGEVRFLKNILVHIQKKDDQNRYRRSLVLMLYAHFEGFSKVAFTEYASQVNGLSLRCREVQPAIVASTWADVLHDLEEVQNKSQQFGSSRQYGALTSDDSKFRRLVRRAEFIELMSDFESRNAHIADSALDLESNLSSKVLRKLLFALGLEHEVFKGAESTLNNLLTRRNSIAHGAERGGIEQKQYDDLETVVYSTMRGLVDLIMEALKNKSFMRPASNPRVAISLGSQL